jgi:hypothetical protein
MIELREEIEDADHCADLERAARARIELDGLVAHLSAATGLGGKTRLFGRDAERARISVQKAIKRAIARISEIDPNLGGDIANRVVTGAQCAFLGRPAG